MSKMYDLAIGNGGHINMWSRGFFEECAKMAGNKFNEDDYIVVGQFRMRKSEYKRRKEDFDKYMNGLNVK